MFSQVSRSSSAAAVFLTSCAAPPPQSAGVTGAAPAPTPRVGDISNEIAETPPHVGMTKAEALALYGESKKRTMSDEGENWIYVLNMGEVIGKAFIPFNFKPTLARTGVLIFGPDGRVKKFNWDAPTNG